MGALFDLFDFALWLCGSTCPTSPIRLQGKSVARAGAKEQSSDVYKVVKMIMDRNYDPVIVFSFSKKECESLAMQMASLDLNSEDEKKMVSSIFHRCGSPRHGSLPWCP